MDKGNKGEEVSSHHIDEPCFKTVSQLSNQLPLQHSECDLSTILSFRRNFALIFGPKF